MRREDACGQSTEHRQRAVVVQRYVSDHRYAAAAGSICQLTTEFADDWKCRCPPPPPRVAFRRVAVSLRGPGQSPVLPFACCVGSLRSVGRCGRCSCWCCFCVRGAPSLVCPPPFGQQAVPCPCHMGISVAGPSARAQDPGWPSRGSLSPSVTDTAVGDSGSTGSL